MKSRSNDGMFKEASPTPFAIAKVLRINLTSPEKKLWNILSGDLGVIN